MYRINFDVIGAVVYGVYQELSVAMVTGNAKGHDIGGLTIDDETGVGEREIMHIIMNTNNVSRTPTQDIWFDVQAANSN